MTDLPHPIQDNFQEVATKVRHSLKTYLLHRHRLIAHEHEDLLQQALEDLFRFVAGHHVATYSEEELRALAFVIIKRRIADLFRSTAMRTSVEHTANDERTFHEIADDKPEVERVVHYRQMLWLVLDFMTHLNERDRELLFVQAGLDDQLAPLTPNERKRLSRLREKLRVQIEARGALPDLLKKRDVNG